MSLNLCRIHRMCSFNRSRTCWFIRIYPYRIRRFAKFAGSGNLNSSKIKKDVLYFVDFVLWSLWDGASDRTATGFCYFWWDKSRLARKHRSCFYFSQSGGFYFVLFWEQPYWILCNIKAEIIDCLWTSFRLSTHLQSQKEHYIGWCSFGYVLQNTL